MIRHKLYCYEEMWPMVLKLSLLLLIWSTASLLCQKPVYMYTVKKNPPNNVEGVIYTNCM